MSGPSIAITPNGVGVSRQFAAQGNSYFTTDNGVYKQEREDLPYLEAGLPPGLDVQVERTDATGPIKADSQTAYRIVFGRKDAQGNFMLYGEAPTSFMGLGEEFVVPNGTEYSVGGKRMNLVAILRKTSYGVPITVI